MIIYAYEVWLEVVMTSVSSLLVIANNKNLNPYMSSVSSYFQ